MWIGMNIRFFLLAVNLVLLSGGMAANDARRTPVVRAVEKALPAVVNIQTESVVEVRDPFAEMFRDFWTPHYGQPRPDVRRS